MILVSGTITVHPGTREEYLILSLQAIKSARRADGCQDFVVAADPLELDRVNVYEAWDSAETLLAFRGDGAGEDITRLIVRANVHEYDAVPREA